MYFEVKETLPCNALAAVREKAGYGETAAVTGIKKPAVGSTPLPVLKMLAVCVTSAQTFLPRRALHDKSKKDLVIPNFILLMFPLDFWPLYCIRWFLVERIIFI